MSIENRNVSLNKADQEAAAMNQGRNGDEHDDTNRDPLSGETGAHPVGTGVGAASVGAVTTVVGGLVGGPVGAVVGAVVGSVMGGLAGKSTAEELNPTVEEHHWQENYNSRPYVTTGEHYQDYQPAYQIGYQGYTRYASSGRAYSEIEPDLQREYEANHGEGIAWEKACPAVKDAWDRMATSRNP